MPLLIFGYNSRRYKDIYDMYYLKDVVDKEKVHVAIKLLIFDDAEMRENDYGSIIKRVENSFKDKQYLRRISGSRQRWIDEDIETISSGIITWLKAMQ